MLGFNKKEDDKGGEDVKQYQDALKTLGEQYDAAQKELQGAKAQIQQLQGELTTAKGTASGASDADAKLHQEFEAKNQQLQAQVQQLQAQVTHAQSEATKAKQQLDAAHQPDGLQEVAQLRSRVSELEAQLAQGQQGQANYQVASSEDRTYTVQSGDTLRAIAQQFYGDEMQYMRIFHANRDQLENPDLIHPGQVLHVPNA